MMCGVRVMLLLAFLAQALAAEQANGAPDYIARVADRAVKVWHSSAGLDDTAIAKVLPAQSRVAAPYAVRSTVVNHVPRLPPPRPLVASSAQAAPIAPAEVVKVADDLDEIMTCYKENVMPTYGRYSIAMARGEGVRLFDTTGKEYLDFAAGISTCALGHSHEGLSKAVAQQMSSVHHVSNLYYIPQQAALAEWLVRTSCAEKAFFCNSGAEANEGAIKLARRRAVNRGIAEPVIITALDSFHGRTMGALTATGQPKYQKDFGPMLSGFEYVKYNDIADLEAIVERLASARAAGSPQGLAAIMLEPLQGEGGIRPGNKDFFRRARELCDEHGAILIMDEVQTGVGRTGKLWGHEHTGVLPDVFTSAKALGGGVPIGAMLARGEAAEVFGPGDHASTFGGNPLACAAGLAVAQELEGADGSFAMLKQVESCGEQLRKGLLAIGESRPGVVKEVRGWGLIDGVELEDKEDVPTAAVVVSKAIEKGLLLVPAGVRVIRFVPPLIVTEQDIKQALESFAEALDEATKEMGSGVDIQQTR
eukprot:gnl/TRDRNA2_/TRDRNA2_37049_c0_seq1.p1 gnl/TRDRNA2_/TRDRNA2_37049_c0~~gnl/TRDRNA2_/TRDRNA2_37049_c0_seq1.p1  ORF type:complete len:535 (+),score=117.89 gnl/TRDRNA2_/TRDRNA2_37049_c0_seq1:47-1651(+)